jgi:RNA polymerase sigma-70 factor (ECF subfamily)
MVRGAMAKAAPSDAELVSQAQAGRSEAFGRLVERHQDYVYSSVCYLVGSGPDAEDIAQDVFVSAYRALGKFEGRARFTTWLYGIMLNSVRSYWRRQKKVTVLSMDLGGEGEDPAPQFAAQQDGPAELTARAERVGAVRQAIAGLDERLREVIVLRDIQGLSYEELAEALELPDGTVKSRLHRARRDLMKRLKPYWDAQE